MIDERTRAEILRLYHAEGWPVGTIAVELGVHHETVARLVSSEGVPRLRNERPSMLEAYLPFIRATLEQHPRLRARRLYDMCVARGYPGGPDHFRHQIRGLRPQAPAEAYLRLAPLPGEQAQVDWAHFGRVAIGRARRQLVAFVMVLSWSRMIFVRFFLGAPMECFVRGHVAAFAFFGGAARVLLYDNLKSAVAERRGDAIRFHPTLLALAAHYRFEPRPVAVRRGNEKGRVERAIRFVRDSFFAARPWRDLDDLNAQAREWCLGRAAGRRWAEDRSKTVGEAFEEERGKLLELSGDGFPTERVEEVTVGKSPYVRFDLNDYSVPHTYVRRTLTVAASEKRVRILDGEQVVCEHDRSYGKDEQIEERAHVEELAGAKRRARKGRVKERLVRAAPSVERLFEELARRGANLGSRATALERLLEEHGGKRLEAAVREALERGTPEPQSVRMILDRERLEAGQAPRVPVDLPDDPRVREVVVRPASLERYGVLRDGGEGDDDDRQDERSADLDEASEEVGDGEA